MEVYLVGFDFIPTNGVSCFITFLSRVYCTRQHLNEQVSLGDWIQTPADLHPDGMNVMAVTDPFNF